MWSVFAQNELLQYILLSKHINRRKGGNQFVSKFQQFLKRIDVIVAAVPQIEGLTSDDFLSFAEGKPSLLKYLPDQMDWLHLDKKWITDILLSLDTDGVNNMIQSAKEQRRQRLDISQNNLVHMKPQFIDALNNSISFSGKLILPHCCLVSKGRSAFLLKQSTKRKSRQPNQEEEKYSQNVGTKSKQKFMEQNQRVRNEINELRGQVDDLVNYKQLVMQLHEGGIIDQEGNPLNLQPSQQDNNFMI
ncbi:hypothetical protein OXYTRIMIC_740 [Oxytricha trifallax]|uniref:Uncharacterized protein n=1 Tax=Oxytricha trifallax TaxID=1172189 RepID=A0A073HYD8_9SPIT|nr:hypothetical protein OXYTRIMIC_740 [Oxytricha trifallax]